MVKNLHPNMNLDEIEEEVDKLERKIKNVNDLEKAVEYYSILQKAYSYSCSKRTAADEIKEKIDTSKTSANLTHKDIDRVNKKISSLKGELSQKFHNKNLAELSFDKNNE